MYHNYNYNTNPTTVNETYNTMWHKYQKTICKSKLSAAGLNTVASSIIFQVLAIGFVFVYNVFSSNQILPSYLDSIPNNLLNGIVSLLGMGVLSYIFVLSGKKPADNVYIFKKVKASTLVRLVMVGFAVCMLANVITNTFLTTMEGFGLDLDVDYESPASDSTLEAIVYFVSVAVVPAVSEELFFRGLILSNMREFGDGFGIFSSALLFGLMHGNFVQIPFAFFVGLVLGFVTVYSGSMLPAMIIHCLNNGYSVIADLIDTNKEALSLNDDINNIILLFFLSTMMIAGVLSLLKLTKSDNNFLKLKSYQGIIDKKTRNKLFIFSPGILVAILFFLGESVLNLIMI